MNLTKVRYPDHEEFWKVYQWCRENCAGQWYSGNDWNNWQIGKHNRMIEFVDEQDAVLFALKWT